MNKICLLLDENAKINYFIIIKREKKIRIKLSLENGSKY